MMTKDDILKKAYEVYPPRWTKMCGDGEYDCNCDRRAGYIQALVDMSKELSTDKHKAYCEGKMEAVASIPKDNRPKIKAWVVKDEFGTHIYRRLPYRVNGVFSSHWTDELGPNSEWTIDDSVFPDLKWEDEPVQVEISIDRI